MDKVEVALILAIVDVLLYPQHLSSDYTKRQHLLHCTKAFEKKLLGEKKC